MTNTHYRKLAVGLIFSWFLLSLLASALKVYGNNSDLPSLALALASLAPIVLFLSWYAASSGFRRFVFSLNPHLLTMAQTWRINGVLFLVLSALGILPVIFAVPAGLGDMATGATAPLVARRFAVRGAGKGFVGWQILGMLDLVMAVSLGTTAVLITRAGPGMGAMTVLPLSLVPTFIVPLFFIFHMICVVQARQGSERQNSRLESSTLV